MIIRLCKIIILNCSVMVPCIENRRQLNYLSMSEYVLKCYEYTVKY